ATLVKDAKGKTIGVWVNFAGFDLVEDIMVEIHGSLAADGLKTAELTLLDPKGTVIGAYDPAHDKKPEYQRDAAVIGKLNLVTAQVKGAKEALAGETGFAPDSFHARKRLTVPIGYTKSAGAYDYPGLGWSALVRADPAEAFSTVNEIQEVMAWLVFSSAIVLAIAGLIVGRSAARPIVNLTGTMRSLAGGDTSVNVPSTGRGDEIGEMARTVEVFKQYALRVAESLEQERELNQRQRRFVSVVAHEFRTPLTIIDGAGQRLARNASVITAAQVHERVDKIRGAVARMNELIETSLQAARLDSGAVELKRGAVDVGILLRGISERIRGISPEFGFDIVTPATPVIVAGDDRLLDQVITNLLTNAVKYSGDSRRIELTLAIEGSRASLSVRDHGLGIPDDEQPKLFTRFYRASTARLLPGTGIGLSLVRDILTMHGGDISVDSAVGRGSTFVIRLPLDVAARQRLTTEAA
ncbi:MAG: HAMP domain-containing histidine kinase, partial [Alphaproteobacteria bacterium]|nr:HAMP domain-containing histidine kinase [Alphaproteobacteria bacterium]